MPDLPKPIKYKIADIDQDEKAEQLLRQLGFKPNEIFSAQELEEKVGVLATLSNSQEPDKFIENTLITLFESNLLRPYFRYISNQERERLKTRQGAKLKNKRV